MTKGKRVGKALGSEPLKENNNFWLNPIGDWSGGVYSATAFPIYQNYLVFILFFSFSVRKNMISNKFRRIFNLREL